MPGPVIAQRIGWPYSEGPLKKLLARIRPEYVGIDPADRVVYEPGQIAQCDLWFPETPVPVTAGQARILPVLVVTLAFSRFHVGDDDPLAAGRGHPVRDVAADLPARAGAQDAGLGPGVRDRRHREAHRPGGGVRRDVGHEDPAGPAAGPGVQGDGRAQQRVLRDLVPARPRFRLAGGLQRPTRRLADHAGEHPHRPGHPRSSGGSAGDRPPGDDAAAAGGPAGRADPSDPAGAGLLRAGGRQRLLRRPASHRPVRRRHRLTHHGRGVLRRPARRPPRPQLGPPRRDHRPGPRRHRPPDAPRAGRATPRPAAGPAERGPPTQRRPSRSRSAPCPTTTPCSASTSTPPTPTDPTAAAAAEASNP